MSQASTGIGSTSRLLRSFSISVAPRMNAVFARGQEDITERLISPGYAERQGISGRTQVQGKQTTWRRKVTVNLPRHNAVIKIPLFEFFD